MAEAVEKTWPEWEDCLGNFYGPGDIVAIATINGKSPQLVIARVERINRVNSKGEPITTREYFEYEKPILKDRTCHKGGGDAYSFRFYPGHACSPECLTFWEKGEYRPTPSCTVRCTPLQDARGFRRWGKKEGEENRAVTYSIPDNIILIERAGDL